MRSPSAVGSLRRGTHPLALLIVATAAGFLLARFLLSQADRSPPPPPPPRTLAEQMRALERRVAARPEDQRAWQALAVAYVRTAAQTGDAALYTLAEKALDRAEVLRPGDPSGLLGRGALALARHEFEAALDLGRRAWEANPDNAQALAMIVDAEIELGRYTDAADHLQEMVDRRPGLPALARVSYLRELHGDSTGALEAMQQAEAAGAGAAFDLASIGALRGDLHFQDGDLDDAEKAYRRALRISPGLVEAEIGRARVAAARGSPMRAIAMLRPVVERYPRFDAVVLLGELQSAVGMEREAAGSYEVARALIGVQRSAGTIVDLEAARFESDHGDPRAAVDIARRHHARRPTVHAADALAWALHRSGDSLAARPLVDEALRLGTRDGMSRFHAAEILAAVGEAERAKRELAAAFEINPWFSFLHRRAALDLGKRLGVASPAGFSGPALTGARG